MSSTIVLKRHQSAKYRSLGLVGQGQFGQVYCAIHRKTGRLVALKNLNRDRFLTHQFLRELRFLLSLDHPHIANCLALDQSGNGRQLVLDYCEGGTLRDILEQGTQLTLAEILTLIVEVLSALEHAHQKNIIHCDIKPENILLTLSPDGWQAKVSDFGIARLSQEFRGEHTGATGSPAYMAPERFYFQVSAASDLYAVGIVLYELLMGDRPFSGSYNQLMVCHLNHAVKLPNSLPTQIQTVLKKATEKLTPRRFRSATDMKEALIAARKTLTAKELRDRFPQVSVLPSSGTFMPSTAFEWAPGCSSLALTAGIQPRPQLFTACDRQLYGWSLTAAQQVDALSLPTLWKFDTPITQLHAMPGGVVVVTDRQLHFLTETQIIPLAEFDRPVKVLPGSQRWAFVQTTESPTRLWLVDTQQRLANLPRPLPPLAAEGMTHLTALDDRHYAIAECQENQSILRVMSRKGQLLGKVKIRSPIHHLFASQKSACCMAIAGTQSRDFLVIKLRPYRIMRCRLDITPTWLGELVTGYVAISQAGQMRLVNLQGQLIGQVNNMPAPRAVAFQPPHQIWLVSSQKNAPQLHCIDIRELGLDIIF